MNAHTKTGMKCHYCKVDTTPTTHTDLQHPTRDHRLPRVRGGGKGPNLVLCCVACNRLKADMTEDEFEYFIQTGRLAASYVDWLTERFVKLAQSFGRKVG